MVIILPNLLVDQCIGAVLSLPILGTLHVCAMLCSLIKSQVFLLLFNDDICLNALFLEFDCFGLYLLVNS